MDATVRAERHELLRLAKAFDGMGGAIHEGRGITVSDLEEAERAAREVWPTDGPAGLSLTLHGACDALLVWAPDAAQGDRVALGYVQRATYAVAKALRTHATIAGEAAPPMPRVEEQIERLDAAYARYAPHPALDLLPKDFR
ncbi:MAG: hypothetical protein ABR562_03235 [Thermoplasmatota archaeon]